MGPAVPVFPQEARRDAASARKDEAGTGAGPT